MADSMPLKSEAIAVLTTGGTIDKVYFDASSQFEIGDSVVAELLREAHVDCEFALQEVMRKDSLDLDDADRASICAAVRARAERCVVITHGTDTLAMTAEALTAEATNADKRSDDALAGEATGALAEKTVVLTGALSPARFAKSDATFNVGMAFAAAQTLPPGIYIVMSGQVFASGHVRKDKQNNVFVRC